MVFPVRVMGRGVTSAQSLCGSGEVPDSWRSRAHRGHPSFSQASLGDGTGAESRCSERGRRAGWQGGARGALGTKGAGPCFSTNGSSFSWRWFVLGQGCCPGFIAGGLESRSPWGCLPARGALPSLSPTPTCQADPLVWAPSPFWSTAS